MGKIKDFIYNQSDIFLAILILALAGFIIVTKVGDITSYPERKMAAQPKESKSVEAAKESDISNKDSESPEKKESSDSNVKQPENQPAKPNTAAVDSSVKCSIYVPYGSTGEHIAGLIVSSGLMDNKQQFFNTLKQLGAEGKLKSGNFIIPLNATDKEIIQYLTGEKK